jgi:hypothetical protein
VVAWAAHAGPIGGLLKGVADLTVDGRAPDVSNFLERLSKKVVRDPPLSTPLHVLAMEVATWLDLVEHCGDLLADGGVLAQAYQRRRIRRFALGGVGGAGLLGVVGGFLWLHAARARVEEALGAVDPCAALSIDPGDLARASAGQTERARDRSTACEDRRRRDAAVREEQHRHEEQTREADRQRKAREARCDALADHVDGGKELTPEDRALADAQLPLIQRTSRHALDLADMATRDLPCADTPAGARIAKAFSDAVVASPAAWANADDLSDRVMTILVERAADLPSAPKQQVQAHADNLVRRAMIQKTPVATEQATRACKLKDDLGVRGAKYCPGLAALRAAGKL